MILDVEQNDCLKVTPNIYSGDTTTSRSWDMTVSVAGLRIEAVPSAVGDFVQNYCLERFIYCALCRLF